MTHIDDWLDEVPANEAEAYAKRVLAVKRLPAVHFFAHPDNNLPLFCTYEGERYRCTGASRLGDVWLAEDFTREMGYDKRVDVTDCGDWSAKP